MRMTRSLVAFLMSLMVTVAAVAVLDAQRGDSAAALLRQAVDVETVDGDLVRAIQLYQAIVDRFQKTDRPAAAEAMLKLAQAYDRTADPRSGAVYERILQEFADQSDIANAARAESAPRDSDQSNPARPTVKAVLSSPWQEEQYGRVSKSGRYIAFVNWHAQGDLFVRDLSNGVTRPVTKGAPADRGESVGSAAFSWDEQRLAYVWETSHGEDELRIAELGQSPSGVRPVLSSPYGLEVSDWTPDGTQVLVERGRPDGTQEIVTVAADSGLVRAIETVDWRGTEGLHVSPDGRYVAFSRAASDTTAQADIHVLALDGSRKFIPVSAPSIDLVLGWVADGSRLIFASDRGGQTGLWSVPFEGGEQIGIVADVGLEGPRGMSRAGALFYYGSRPADVARLQVVSYDFGAEKSSESVTIATGVGENTGTGITWHHAWSADGKLLAYLPQPQGLGRQTGGQVRSLVIRSIDTGAERTIELRMRSLWSNLSWAPDGGSLLVSGADLKGRWGMHRVDHQSGIVTPVALVPVDARDPHYSYRTPEWAPDGRSIFFRRLIRTGTAFEEAWLSFDPANGRETELHRRATAGGYGVYSGSILVSPDGRYLAGKASAPGPTDGAKRDTILIVPTDGTPVLELATALSPESLGLLMWAPDGQSVFVKRRSGDVVETWRHALDGTAHRVADPTFDRVDGVGLGIIGYARVAPDGKTVAFGEVDPHRVESPLTDLWVLEGVSPARAR